MQAFYCCQALTLERVWHLSAVPLYSTARCRSGACLASSAVACCAQSAALSGWDSPRVIPRLTCSPVTPGPQPRLLLPCWRVRLVKGWLYYFESNSTQSMQARLAVGCCAGVIRWPLQLLWRHVCNNLFHAACAAMHGACHAVSRHQTCTFILCSIIRHCD
jgi:hypothetical protein